MSYERFYKEYHNQVHECVGTYLMWEQLVSEPSEDDALLTALNDSPTSWILLRHSLQVTTFMSLGRIFDIDGESFSIDDLLKACVEEVHIFSKEQLRIRKIDSCRGKEHDWLDEYISNAYEPVAEDFQRLRPEVAKYRKLFDSNYKPIRHNLFAHTSREMLDRKDELWAQTNIGEIESIIWFINDLELTLWETFHNGSQPILQGREPNTKFYVDDFNVLLSKIKNT